MFPGGLEDEAVCYNSRNIESHGTNDAESGQVLSHSWTSDSKLKARELHNLSQRYLPRKEVEAEQLISLGMQSHLNPSPPKDST